MSVQIAYRLECLLKVRIVRFMVNESIATGQLGSELAVTTFIMSLQVGVNQK